MWTWFQWDIIGEPMGARFGGQFRTEFFWVSFLSFRGPNGQPKNVDLSEDLIAQVFKLCETAKVSVLEAPKSLSTELAIPIEKSEPQQFEKSIGLNSSDVGLSFADHIMSHKVCLAMCWPQINPNRSIFNQRNVIWRKRKVNFTTKNADEEESFQK